MASNLFKSFAVSVLCLSSSHAFGGAYVGLDAGLTNMSLTHRVKTAYGPGKTQVTANGIAYGAHGGYLYEVGSSKTIVGGEAYLNLAMPNPSVKFGADGDTPEGVVKIKRSRSIGAAAIVGKMMNIDTLVYGRIGLEHATYYHHFSFASTTSVPGFSGKQIKKGFSFLAPVVGAGIAYKINRTTMIGAELQLANFFKKKNTVKGPDFQANLAPSEKRILGRASFVLG